VRASRFASPSRCAGAVESPVLHYCQVRGGHNTRALNRSFPLSTAVNRSVGGRLVSQQRRQSPAPRRRSTAAGSSTLPVSGHPRRRAQGAEASRRRRGKFRPTSAEKSPASSVTFHARDSISGSTSSDQSLKRCPPQALLTLGRRPCNSRRACMYQRPVPGFLSSALRPCAGYSAAYEKTMRTNQRQNVTCDLRAASIFYVDRVVSASG